MGTNYSNSVTSLAPSKEDVVREVKVGPGACEYVRDYCLLGDAVERCDSRAVVSPPPSTSNES
jgi:hypothetical protein